MNFYAQSRKLLELIKKNPEDYTEEEQKEFNDIDKILLKANELYYKPDEESFLTDKEFDELLKFRNKYSDTEIDLKPKVNNGTKITHTVENLMGTIKKVTDGLDEVRRFFEDLHDNYGDDCDKILATLKIDGWSVALDIDGDTVTRAYSRGQDGQGEDYSKIFAGMKFDYCSNEEGDNNVPDCIHTLKCECAMTFEDFEEYNKIYKELNGKELANPRFAVGSILSNDDGKKFAKYLSLFPIEDTADVYDNREEEFSKIMNPECCYGKNNMGIKFIGIPCAKLNYVKQDGDNDIYVEGCSEIFFTMWKSEWMYNLQEFYDSVTKDKIDGKMNYMCDGIVFEILDEQTRKDVGYGQTDGKACPNYAIAIKFPVTKVKTKIIDFEWDVAYSLSGKVTPCVRIEPRKIDGRTFDRVSLSYLDRIVKEDFRKGEEVFLEIRGDVLGYISKDPDFDNSKLPKTKPIFNCPVCGNLLTKTVSKDGIESLICKNDECPNKKSGKFINYINQMRIKGIDTSIINTMVSKNYIVNIKDLYDFDSERLSKEEGFGKKSVQNIINAIEARTEVYDYEFFGAWNWKNIARERMKLLFQKVNWEVVQTNFYKLIRQEFIKWICEFEGFSKINAGNLYDGLTADLTEIEEIIEKNFVRIKSSKLNVAEGFEPKKIVVTGDLKHWKDRNDFKTKIELMGHKMIGSISKKTDYLVTNTPNSGTVKNKKAKELGIPVVTEEEIIKILGIRI